VSNLPVRLLDTKTLHLLLLHELVLLIPSSGTSVSVQTPQSEHHTMVIIQESTATQRLKRNSKLIQIAQDAHAVDIANLCISAPITSF
jgi:hypothetical protein